LPEQPLWGDYSEVVEKD